MKRYNTKLLANMSNSESFLNVEDLQKYNEDYVREALDDWGLVLQKE